MKKIRTISNLNEMHFSKNDCDNNPITEKDDLADILLNMNKNGNVNTIINVHSLPTDHKEWNLIEFYDIAIKLVKILKTYFVN